MLLIHILFSILGIIGAYSKDNALIRRIGLVGVIISGIFLFRNNPQTFLESGKFISNMTVLCILLITEFKYLRVVSVFSWTWIFIIAILNPPFPYWIIMVAYCIGLSVVWYKTQRQRP